MWIKRIWYNWVLTLKNGWRNNNRLALGYFDYDDNP
jgi:hypothetical protein